MKFKELKQENKKLIEKLRISDETVRMQSFRIANLNAKVSIFEKEQNDLKAVITYLESKT